MGRLLLGNFDFEWRLAQGPRPPLPASLQRLNHELALTWLAVANPDDAILCPARLPLELRPALQQQWSAVAGRTWPRFIESLADVDTQDELTPWGWTESVLAEWSAVGRTAPLTPSLEVVRRVNSRAFSAALEDEWSCGPEGASLVRSLTELYEQLRRHVNRHGPDARWVLKANYCHSARERLLGCGGALPTNDEAWATARLARDGVLAWEPWLEIVEEVGLQWEVPRDGPPQLIGITPLLTDAAGRYRGSLFGIPESELRNWQAAIDTTRAAAERLQAAGYWGPLGIDACRYRTSEQEISLRPLQDLNARWTMGRLSLGWQSCLQPGEWGVWKFGTGESRSTRWPLPSHPLRTIVLSPERLDDQPVRLRYRVEIYAAGKPC